MGLWFRVERLNGNSGSELLTLKNSSAGFSDEYVNSLMFPYFDQEGKHDGPVDWNKLICASSLLCAKP